MSQPPLPPSGPPPAGPPPGWGPPPPGWGPPGQAPYDAGRPRRNVGLVVAVVAVLVLLVGGIATTALLLANGDGDGERTAGTDTGTDTSTEASTATPTGPASETASAPGTLEVPTPPVSPTTPATPYSPTDDTGDDIHTDVEASDYPGDWNFKLGDVEHTATLRQSWDYDSCGPVEEASVLTQQRCEYSVQWTYAALGGKARITHVFLVFDTERHAKAAESRLKDSDLDLRDEAVLPDFVQGKWNKSVYGNVVGVTVGTTKATVPDKELQSLVNYMNTDYRLALLFKS